MARCINLIHTDLFSISCATFIYWLSSTFLAASSTKEGYAHHEFVVLLGEGMCHISQCFLAFKSCNILFCFICWFVCLVIYFVFGKPSVVY